MSRLRNVSDAVIYRVTDCRERLSVAYANGANKETLSQLDIPVGERLSGWVAATGESMCNADAALDLMGAAPHLCSAVAVPLKTRDVVAGVIVLYAAVPDAFGETTERLLESVASSIVASL